MSFKPIYITILVILGSLLLQKLHARSAEGFLMLQTKNSSRTSKDATYRIQILENGKDVLLNEEATSERLRDLENLCPKDLDCEDFFESFKYFIVEFVATFAGLSWGAWSNLMIAFSEINS